MLCASCGAESAPKHKFCHECGALLAPAGGKPQRNPQEYTPLQLADKILTFRSALKGEQRCVTALVADVQGSLRLSERVGADDVADILDRTFQILSDGVYRFEGAIDRFSGFSGGGILAFFGAPLVNDDHAHRACRAALCLSGELRAYGCELRRTRGLDFAVRIGLHSGEIRVDEVGDDLRMTYTAPEGWVGLAEHIQQATESGSIYLSQDTAQLVKRCFPLRALGPFALGDARGPVQLHELGLRGAES